MAIVTILTASGLGWTSVIAEPQQYVPSAVESVTVSTYESLLEGLAKCESGGKPDIKILDTNGKYSYGMYQFQLATFYSFGKKAGVLSPDLELAEAENLIYDPILQRRVALYMMEIGVWEDHWVICSKKLLVNK